MALLEPRITQPPKELTTYLNSTWIQFSEMEEVPCTAFYIGNKLKEVYANS